MKKIESRKLKMLDDDQLPLVTGGMSRSDAINTALGGDPGCGAGARSAQHPTPSPTYSGGCGAGARNAARSSGGGSHGSSRVICTHFFKKGMIDPDVWRADLQYTQNHLSETTVRGYHFWAVPYVRLMRKSSLAEKVMYPIAKYRAIELAYQMKVVEKGSFRGKLIRLVFEPTCFVIGAVCKQRDWEALWN